MKQKIIHPLWTHIPALLMMAFLILVFITQGPFPERVPIHFDMNGIPNSSGTPWAVFILLVALSLLFISISFIIDELWARQENKKLFNWLSLFDEIVIGTMAGINAGYISYLNEGNVIFTFPWEYFLISLFISMIIAIIIESIRPYRPYQQQLLPTSEDTDFKNELEYRIKDSTNFVFWDYQNPFYVSMLTTALPILFILAAIFSMFDQLWVGILLIVVGLLMIIPHGGQRSLVTRDNITVRWGMFGLKVLNIPVSEIADAKVITFAPLKDFGGYGIRFNSEMKAFFLRGNRGIKLTTLKGKRYLIGSDIPEKTLMVVKAVTGRKG